MSVGALLLAIFVVVIPDGDPADGAAEKGAIEGGVVEGTGSGAQVALVVSGDVRGFDVGALLEHVNAGLAEHPHAPPVVLAPGDSHPHQVRLHFVDDDNVLLSIPNSSERGGAFTRAVSLSDTPVAARPLVLAAALQDLLRGPAPSRRPSGQRAPAGSGGLDAPGLVGGESQAHEADVQAAEVPPDFPALPLLTTLVVGGGLTAALYPVAVGLIVMGVLVAHGVGIGLISAPLSAALVAIGLVVGVALAAGAPLGQGLLMSGIWDQVSTRGARWGAAIVSSYASAGVLALAAVGCGAVAFGVSLLVVPTFIGSIILLGLPLFIYLPIAAALYLGVPAAVLTTAAVVQPFVPTAAIALTARPPDGGVGAALAGPPPPDESPGPAPMGF